MNTENRLGLQDESFLMRDQEPITGEKIFDATEIFRKENDPRLVAVMQRLHTVLSKRLPEYYEAKEQEAEEGGRSGPRRPSTARNKRVYTFRYIEEVETDSGRVPFNRLVVIGPHWPGLGMIEESMSITTYNESDKAIIGHTVFMADKNEIEAVSQSEDISEALTHTSLAVLHFPAVEWQHTEKVDQYNPHGFGYVNGRRSVSELPWLLQMNLAINGRTGFIYTGNLRNGQSFDVLSHAENLVSILEQETTEQDKTYQMRFVYKEGGSEIVEVREDREEQPE